MTIKYAVGQCRWEKRETADSGYDLVLDVVDMCEFIDNTHSGLDTLKLAVQERKIFIVLDITNQKGPQLLLSSGYIPGRVLTSHYDLRAKLDRISNEIVGRALSQIIASVAPVETK